MKIIYVRECIVCPFGYTDGFLGQVYWFCGHPKTKNRLVHKNVKEPQVDFPEWCTLEEKNETIHSDT
jgi:hypothetical protein